MFFGNGGLNMGVGYERLTDVCMHYVPFFDLKDAILDMIFTTNNIMIYKKKIP